MAVAGIELVDCGTWLRRSGCTKSAELPDGLLWDETFWRDFFGGDSKVDVAALLLAAPLFLLGVLGVDGSADPGAVGDRACASSYFFFRVMFFFIREACSLFIWAICAFCRAIISLSLGSLALDFSIASGYLPDFFGEELIAALEFLPVGGVDCERAR